MEWFADCYQRLEYIIRIRTPWDGLGKLERGERWLEEDGLEDLYGPLADSLDYEIREAE